MNFTFAAVPPKTSEDRRIDRYQHPLLRETLPRLASAMSRPQWAARHHSLQNRFLTPPAGPRCLPNAPFPAPTKSETSNTTARAVIVARLGFLYPHYDMGPRTPTLVLHPRRRFHPIPSRCHPPPASPPPLPPAAPRSRYSYPPSMTSAPSKIVLLALG